MTQMTPSAAPGSRWSKVRHGIAEVLNAQIAVWDALGRVDPDPDPYLHWEPTMSGWRLYGHLVPPD